MPRVLRRPWIALVVALVVECAIFVRGQPDFVASDPLWYSEIAHRMAVDPASVFAAHDLHPFVMRIGLTGPLALLYKLFGVSSATTNLPALFAALAILLVIYAAMPTPRAKLVGLAMGACSTALLQNAMILNVDLPCAALMATSVLWLGNRDRRRGAYWLAGAAAAWLAAFLVKEVAIWCAPVWIYAIACDVRALDRRAVIRRYVPALITGAVLGAGYLWLCAALWGDPFARAHGISALTDEHAWSLRGHPASDWLARMVWQPPILFARLFQATLAPALVAPWLVRGRQRIWCVASVTFAACYWFGSSSFAAYVPLPISARMVLPLLPPVLVTGALAFDQLLDRRRWRYAVIALGIAIALPPLHIMFSLVTRPHPEAAAFDVLRREARDEQVLLVCGEPRCVAISDWYFGFDRPAHLAVIHANDFAAAPLPTGVHVRALVNRVRAPGAHRTDPKSDRTAEITALGMPILAGNKNITLYDAGDGAALQRALH
jgi:hypothetical protein